MISNLDAQYYHWHKLLEDNQLFRAWWQFWSNYAFLFFVLILFLSGDSRFFQIAALCVVAFGVTRLIFTPIFSHFFPRTRPYQHYHFTPLTSRFFSRRVREHYSFPSRHVASYAAIAAVIGMFNPVLGIILFAATIMTGIGRLILGYHWPADIIGGLLIGSLIGAAITILSRGLIFT